MNEIKNDERLVNYEDIYVQISIPLTKIVENGTGYRNSGNVVVETMKVLEPSLFEDINNKPAYELLKQRFDNYANKGQVKFVTLS